MNFYGYFYLRLRLHVEYNLLGDEVASAPACLPKGTVLYVPGLNLGPFNPKRIELTQSSQSV
jgi:hypothetical protein